MPFNPDKFLAETAPNIQQAPQPQFNPDRFLAETQNMRDPNINQGKALMTGLERVATFETRPAIAGAGGFAGGLVGGLQAGQNFQEAFETAKQSYRDARDETLQEQEKLQEAYPGTTLAGQLGGAILTAPVTAVRGITGAAKLGGALGLGEAIGRGESLPEAAKSIALGAGTGALGGAVLKGIEVGGKAGIKALKKVMPDKLITKLEQTVTGVPEKTIQTFKDKTDKILKLSKEVGGDYQEAANLAKEKIAADISKTIGSLNDEIGKALDDFNPNKLFKAKPILRDLNNAKNRLNKALDADQITQIEELTAKIQDAAGESGKLSLRDLNDVKKHLQNVAKPSYIKNGQLFSPGKAVQKAAKEAAFTARLVLDEVSPKIANTNAKLAQLHKLEGELNKSLLKVGASESSFIAAGAGAPNRNTRALQQIGELTGTNPLAVAEELAASRQFYNPPLLPLEPTGKAPLRTIAGAALGAGAGALTSNLVGVDPGTGAIIGAALASPAALKAIIMANNLGSKGVTAGLNALADPRINSVVSRLAAEQGISLSKVRKRLKNSIKALDKQGVK